MRMLDILHTEQFKVSMLLLAIVGKIIFTVMSYSRLPFL
jgi:hypothetical protein